MEVKQDFTYHVKPNKLDVGGENSASFRANPLAGQDHAHRKVLHPWGPADGTELAEPVGSSWEPCHQWCSSDEEKEVHL